MLRTTREASRENSRRAYIDTPRQLQRELAEALERTKKRLDERREYLARQRRARVSDER
jgi:hypothetical protein